ncbi:MAG: DUF4040 domain-containing protein [Verrucomicrobia bacterium]|nr:DUF4040 domain-containing protein [Verrucomicrobiota bacterium]
MIGILTLLLVGGFLTPLFYRRWGDRTASRLALLPALSFLLLVGMGGSMSGQGGIHLISLTWIPELNFTLSFALDGLSLLFALLITGIGAFVVWYSGAYFDGDPTGCRFVMVLMLFMASMLGVVFADHVIVLFIFWELTSFTSFLLIGHNHREEAARKAALQALLVTGAGGLFLLAGLLILARAGGSYELSSLITNTSLPAHPLFNEAIALILVGAFTKSAQVPFHFWLPNAMQAPSPASAYLHSSTMVKAGVYLLARLHPLGVESWLWSDVVAPIGALTLFTGAVMAYGQVYLKRLLAYTTVSALGGMTMLIGFGSPAAAKAAVVFLLAHALYKASLFLVAGIIDHETGEKHIDRLGGLRTLMPWTALGAGLAAVSMMGLPPTLGFLGKELLYAADRGLVYLSISVLAGMFFVYVAYRTGVRPFVGLHRVTQKPGHEAPPAMWAGPMTLGGLSILLAVFASVTGKWIVAPAAQAVLGEPTAIKLVLWHGWNRELMLSLLTLGLGVAAILLVRPVSRLFSPVSRAAVIGPDAWYRAGLKGIQQGSVGLTRILQSGYLRAYIDSIVLFILLTAGWHFLGKVPFPGFAELHAVDINDLILVSLLFVAIAGALLSRSRMAAIASLGVIGYGIALIFVLYGAPDLAMTQMVIETLTVILLVLAFYHLPKFALRSSRPARIRDFALATAVALFTGAMTYAASFGEIAPPISWFYSENSWLNAYGKNVVNVILVDFRAMDTLGEITVLTVAALGAMALLKLRIGGQKGGGS